MGNKQILIHNHKTMLQFLPRPHETLPFRIKATYMYLPKKEIQDKIKELQADNKYEGYTLPKPQFLTILQSLL